MYCAVRRAVPLDRVGEPASGDPSLRAGDTSTSGLLLGTAPSVPALQHTHRGITSTSADEMLNVLDTLHHLESAAVALAAPAVTSRHVSRGRELVAALRCASSIEEAHRLSREFHRSLVALCPNQRILALLQHEMPCGHARRVRGDAGPHSPAPPDQVARAAADHTDILDLLHRGAPTIDIERMWRQHSRISRICWIG